MYHSILQTRLCSLSSLTDIWRWVLRLVVYLCLTNNLTQSDQQRHANFAIITRCLQAVIVRHNSPNSIREMEEVQHTHLWMEQLKSDMSHFQIRYDQLKVRVIQQCWVDSNYITQVVFSFVCFFFAKNVSGWFCHLQADIVCCNCVLDNSYTSGTSGAVKKPPRPNKEWWN